jgi:hypothetical protein
MIKDEENYLSHFYKDFFVGAIFPHEQNQMKKSTFIDIVTREQFEYIFDAKTLRDRFRNFADILESPRTPAKYDFSKDLMNLDISEIPKANRLQRVHSKASLAS